ncbi:hypothetical protein [Aliikangiella sp. G2MR2-5]|uniref:hypothetical protein n=1 Tax=Aliikangiella sp. G2MR2-5 TaxID=2788943 RepID=UPI0018A9AE1E|nr:hypothetical protein [Aliikangiella sp. G2MR2-5]
MIDGVLLSEYLLFPEFGGLQVIAVIIVFSSLLISLTNTSSRLKGISRKYRWLVFSLNLSVALALCGLILKPEIKVSEGKKVYLITANTDFSSEGLNKINTKLSRASFYWLEPTTEMIESYGITGEQVLLSAAQLQIREPSIGHLVVLGDGLTENEWQAISAEIIEFIPSSRVSGILSPEWTQQVNIGEYFRFSGRLNISDAKSSDVFEMQLIDPAGQMVVKRALLNAEFFEVSHRPKLSGNHLYRLQISRMNKTIKQVLISEEIDVEVTGHSKLNLLLLQSAPSFELKNLHNWAAASGAKILSKIQISRDKYITKAVNRELPVSKSLDLEFFSSFDLVVADARMLSQLSESETEALINEVNKGLGMIVIADNSLLVQNTASAKIKPHWLHRHFQLGYPSPKEGSEPVQLSWHDGNGGLVSPRESLVSRRAIKFEHQDRQLISLVYSSKGEPLVVSRAQGKGKIALSLLTGVAGWSTSGDKSNYSLFWQAMIKQVARLGEMNPIIALDQRHSSKVGKAQRLCIRGGDKHELIFLNHGGGQKLKLSPALSEPNRKCAQVWLTREGWYQLSLKNNGLVEAKKAFYSYSKEAWHAQEQNEKFIASLNRVKNSEGQSRISVGDFTPINLWWMWSLFILSASLLWLERKLGHKES